MYTVNVQITGIAPLIQHRFPIPADALDPKGSKVATGARDFSQEWREYLYVNAAGDIVQPSTHIEGCMTKAAAGFKIVGKRGKSYKDLFSAAVFVTPEDIPHGMKAPETLDADGDKPLYIDIRPVVVQRQRIIRLRPTLKAGWKLEFEIQVIDDQISPQVVQEILSLAGRTVGIGDFRPKFGRFMVTRFEVHK